MEMEELFGKLVELGYHCDLKPSRKYPYGASSANLISDFYNQYGYLDGCNLVEERHRKILSKWYRQFVFDSWPGGIAGSGTTFDWSSIILENRYPGY